MPRKAKRKGLPTGYDSYWRWAEALPMAEWEKFRNWYMAVPRHSVEEASREFYNIYKQQQKRSEQQQ